MEIALRELTTLSGYCSRSPSEGAAELQPRAVLRVRLIGQPDGRAAYGAIKAANDRGGPLLQRVRPRPGARAGAGHGGKRREACAGGEKHGDALLQALVGL